MIGVKPSNTGVDGTFLSQLFGAAKVVTVCCIVKPVGEPDAGNPHVRFDERGWETGRSPATAPNLDSTENTGA